MVAGVVPAFGPKEIHQAEDQLCTVAVLHL